MRRVHYLFISFLLLATSAQAGAFLVNPGDSKIIIEYAQSRSSAIIDRHGQKRDFIFGDEDQPRWKKEGSIHIERGVWPAFTLIGKLNGGQQEFFLLPQAEKAERLNWQSVEAGGRLKLYEAEHFVILSLENSYGYRREDISGDPFFKTEEGFFIDAALLLGIPIYLHPYVAGFASLAGRWQSHYQRLEQNTLLSEASLGIDFSKHLVGWRVLLLGDFFTNAEISGPRERRTIEYKLQPSIVVFPNDHIGLQLGARWQLYGKNTTRSLTGFAKIWLEF